jgi:hypothetical protein
VNWKKYLKFADTTGHCLKIEIKNLFSKTATLLDPKQCITR